MDRQKEFITRCDMASFLQLLATVGIIKCPPVSPPSVKIMSKNHFTGRSTCTIGSLVNAFGE
jgi:hypothetical protein